MAWRNDQSARKTDAAPSADPASKFWNGVPGVFADHSAKGDLRLGIAPRFAPLTGKFLHLLSSVPT
jgi:hypothetical protein